MRHWWELFFILALGGIHIPSAPAARQPWAPFAGGRFPGTAPVFGTPGNAVTLTNAFPNLAIKNPMGLVGVPGRNRLLIFTKEGVIYSVDQSPQTSGLEVFLDLSPRTASPSDSGMFDVELHPDFGVEGAPGARMFFVFYQHTSGITGGLESGDYATSTSSRISRFEVREDVFEADASSETVLIDQPDRSPWHNGGAMFFHPQDRCLYIALGDEGYSPADVTENSQQVTNNLFSGILRIDVDADPSRSHPIRRQPRNGVTAHYQIPEDNPFLDPQGGLLEEFFAIGLRSPHAMSFDPVTGRIWCGDVGSSEQEEINRIESGGNYGWPFREGFLSLAYPAPAEPRGQLRAPVFAYGRHQGPTGEAGDACIILGPVYRGVELGDTFTGKLIFGDNSSGRLWSLAITEDGSAGEVTLIGQIPGSGVHGLSNFSVDAAGELYCLQLGDPGVIWRFVPGPPPETVPDRLSETGLFTDLASLAPAPGILPYEINQAFWSDGATKRRWLGIPNDGPPYTAQEIALATHEGAWSFPAGTVFIKHFDLPLSGPGSDPFRKLETRLLVIGADLNAYGFTYEWLEDQSDAVIVTAGKERDFPDSAGGLRRWYFPGPSDCVLCHNPAAGHVLGLNTAQLHRPLPGIGASQIEAWEIEQLCAFPANRGSPASWTRHPDITDLTVPLTDRVRTYLDVNCSSCHRPGGSGKSFDARLQTPLLLQGLLDAPVTSRHAGERSRIVHPAHPHDSELLARVETAGPLRMPPVGRNRLDAQAIDMLRAWITALEPPASTPGFAATYFTDTSLQKPAHVQLEASIDHDWAQGPPLDGHPADGFSVRWHGTFAATGAGDYLITTVTDDGVRVYLDGQLVIDDWSPGGLRTNTAAFALAAGAAREVIVEYFDEAGHATCRVLCQLAGEGPDLFQSSHLTVNSSHVQAPTRPVLGLTRGEDNSILLKIRPEGRSVTLQMSTDLQTWTPVHSLPADNTLLLPEPEAPGIFFRLAPSQ
jgi:glucose/arabinose dehydrogenase/mono/diheme cytochrome c family protein